MTKDEMKNRISIALKDPMLQQGFEIICNENAELKERITGLEAYNEELLNDNAEKHHKIVMLEIRNEKLKDNLIKAEDLIKYLCSMVRELNKPNVQLTNVDYSLSEAEQFLKKLEK